MLFYLLYKTILQNIREAVAKAMQALASLKPYGYATTGWRYGVELAVSRTGTGAATHSFSTWAETCSDCGQERALI